MKDRLIMLGYVENKPNLFSKNLGDNIIIYHDYRKENKRVSYAFKNKEKIEVEELQEYKNIKAIEEAERSKTLDKFKPAESNQLEKKDINTLFQEAKNKIYEVLKELRNEISK